MPHQQRDTINQQKADENGTKQNYSELNGNLSGNLKDCFVVPPSRISDGTGVNTGFFYEHPKTNTKRYRIACPSNDRDIMNQQKPMKNGTKQNQKEPEEALCGGASLQGVGGNPQPSVTISTINQ